jgi:anti-anti-sigma factor
VIQGPLEINSRLLRKELYLMKRHLTASAVSLGRQHDDSVIARAAVAKSAALDTTALDKSTNTLPAAVERPFALTSVSAWTHTLVLTGELNQRSAAALEAEMDRLCEEGVTGITLDLRELTYIDSAAVAAITFRCGLSQRRGYDFVLIPGPQPIHAVFERAGVADVLPFRENELDAPSSEAVASGHRSRERCEQ